MVPHVRGGALWAGLTGWDLIKELHSIGIGDPVELARLLEDEDPFQVRRNTGSYLACTCGGLTEAFLRHSMARAHDGCCEHIDCLCSVQRGLPFDQG